MSIPHPDKFPFSIRFQIISSWSIDLNYYPKDIVSEVEIDGQTYSTPPSGHFSVEGIHMWVINQSKSGWMTYYFQSREDYDKLEGIFASRRVKNVAIVQHKIYRFNTMSLTWNYAENYTFNDTSNLIGCDHYIKTVEKDIANYIKNRDFLESIGEDKSTNYLLYGVPGVGKTTFIKTLASKNNFSIYIVNPNGLSFQHLSRVLNPVGPGDTSPIKMLLFEDFDRFLSDNDKEKLLMSQILNSLDGLEDKGACIRFFTGNNCELIFANKALINRMSGKFLFDYPNKQILDGKFERLLTYYTKRKDFKGFNEDFKIKKDKYLDMVIHKKVTIRPFVNYSIRYLFDDNFIDKMIENIEEL